MREIVVLDRYATKIVYGFTKSFKELVLLSLQDLGYKVRYLSDYEEIKDDKDCLILAIISPENFISQYNLIPSGNRVLWWNLEPFYLDEEKTTNKLRARRRIMDAVIGDLDGYGLSKVLLFNEDQLGPYGQNKRVKFLPIGFHECLVSTERRARYEVRKDRFVFAGYKSEYRNSFLNIVKKRLRKHRLVRTIVHISHRTQANKFSHRKSIMFRHKYGLDCPSSPYEKHIHWHRIMMHASNMMPVVSHSDLSKYGIVHKKHYIMYGGSTKDCADKMEYLIKLSEAEIKRLANRMFLHIKKHFYMPNLLREALSEEA